MLVFILLSCYQMISTVMNINRVRGFGKDDKGNVSVRFPYSIQ